MIRDLLLGNISQQELFNIYNITINNINLPQFINGFTFHYKGINNIFINQNLSYYKKKRTILHELAHIELSQLEQYDNDLFAFKVDKYEDEADKYLKSILDEIKKT